MDEKAKRVTGTGLGEFLLSLGITRETPVGRSPESGERADDARLTVLLEKGDPISPGPGRVPEESATLERLFAEAGATACFGLTPDGHLTSHEPIRFDPEVAAEQVIRLLEVEMAEEDREEALTATWVGLAYHDHDHPADFGGLVLDAADGRPKCCYLDVKGTRAVSPSAQRTKLEERARERKFGWMAQTVTHAANDGFAGYPGRGKPGLIVTLLHNPVTAEKTHSGFAVGWFFGVRSNYQAAAAVWGWGGKQGVKLPEGLIRLLEASPKLPEQTKSLLERLAEYRDYNQLKDDQGGWDRETLQSTLLAMSLAARYLLMNEDTASHAQQSVADLQAPQVKTPLELEDFHPGESFASYYGRKADKAIEKAEKTAEERDKATERADKATERADKATERADKAEQQLRKEEERQRQLVARRRQKGHADAEIADDLGYTLEELLQRYPRP